MRLTFAVGSTIVMGLLTMCGAELSPGKPRPPLTEADTGRAVKLRVGDQLEITLSGNPTTGFQWEIGSGDTSVIKLSGEPEFNAPRQALGAAGKFTWRFAAVAAGRTTLKLVYRRPFEKDRPPAQTFEVTVTVE